MTRIFDVPGISCDHCKRSIEHEVAAVAGVTSVNVDVEARTVTIDATAPDGLIKAAIHEAGYDIANIREN